MEDRDDAESRIEVDAAVVAALRGHGFSGPKYQRLEEELDRGGRGVLISWMRSGVIFRRCRERGAPLEAPPRRFNQDDRATLANHTLARALPAFRDKALVQGGWRPELGATLFTYFVNSLPLHFANAYRPWCASAREDESWLSSTVREGHTTLYVLGVEAADPEKIYITRESVTRSLRGLDSRTAEALALSADGFTQAEIGSILGISRKAVERLVSRHHQRISRTEDPDE